MSRLSRPVSRRRFLQTSAVAASALSFPTIVSARSPNAKLNLAVIGCGGRGGHNLQQVLGENIVALCDVNETNLDAAAMKAPNAKKFVDFRKLYDSLKDSEFDAVVVSTTEHTHALAGLPALRRKKHLYLEKPISHTVHEARLLTEAAAAAGVATQQGTQIHATENYRRVVELIQAGAIGAVSEAHVWVARAWGRQTEQEAKDNKDIVWSYERPQTEEPIPAGLNWDLWLGPAPQRPFHSIYFPGPKWYRWWDFGNGTMSDLGSHWIDLPFWALNLDAPLTIEASGPAPHPELAPASMSATYEYGPRGKRPACKLTWYQGAMKPQLWLDKKIPQLASGVLFVGSEGMLISDYSKHMLLPEEKFKDYKRPEPSIAPSPGQQAEWLAACKSGGRSLCDFSYAGPLTEANHLGNVALRAGKKLHWDAKQMRFTNAPEAEQFLKMDYRAGWSL
ncbi:MAG: Gfo/Idh/MocA family oxidoreductase [Planctomycetaceae bacterium]|nr:Gfo/Idh/MocA family oxidoreductase [Planctomycetaceae bacterium]